jgi:hypothetical protein
VKFRRADILFIVLIPTVVLCLWLLTTEQTTVRIPADETHHEALQAFRDDGKKAAEKVCRTCHAADRQPLSKNHPPGYRCMFCHKPASPGSSAPQDPRQQGRADVFDGPGSDP